MSADIAADLEAIALVEGVTQAQLLREAVEMLVRVRKADLAFQRKLRHAVERHRQLLGRLADL